MVLEKIINIIVKIYHKMSRYILKNEFEECLGESLSENYKKFQELLEKYIYPLIPKNIQKIPYYTPDHDVLYAGSDLELLYYAYYNNYDDFGKKFIQRYMELFPYSIVYKNCINGFELDFVKFLEDGNGFHCVHFIKII